MCSNVPVGQSLPEEVERVSTNPISLQEAMKKARKAKARQEREMEDALVDLVASSELEKTTSESQHERLPKLKYDTASPLECGKSVGLVFDCRMLKHKASQTLDYGQKHPERPERILRPIERLCGTNTLEWLYLIEGREATKDELSAVHFSDHIMDMESTANMVLDGKLQAKQETFNSVYLCPDSYMSALVSCGSTLSVVERVVKGSLHSGFALVRPPGHHAEAHTACGFCLFNNVAVAAKHAQSIAKDIGLVTSQENYKILILDWDVHHGNGTQNIFYSDPSVLYISLHRFDDGLFFPSSDDADYNKIGADAGLGYNINIAWSGARMGNPEYYTAFENVVMPIAEEFNPDLVLVSSGFDAGKGDPLGGYHVTPNMYGYMTHRLQSLADGKIVVVLEGGYNLNTVSECVLACVQSLLDFSKKEAAKDCDSDVKLKHSTPPRLKPPNAAGLSCILETLEYISTRWTCLQKHKDNIEGILQNTRRAEMEKLADRFENMDLEKDLILDPGADGTGKRHSYSTRAKSRSAQKNKGQSCQDTKKSPGAHEQQAGDTVNTGGTIFHQDIPSTDMLIADRSDTSGVNIMLESQSGDTVSMGDTLSQQESSGTDMLKVDMSDTRGVNTTPTAILSFADTESSTDIEDGQGFVDDESSKVVLNDTSNLTQLQNSISSTPTADPAQGFEPNSEPFSTSARDPLPDLVSTPMENHSSPSESSYFSANSTIDDQLASGGTTELSSLSGSEKVASATSAGMDGSYLDVLPDQKTCVDVGAVNNTEDEIEGLGACAAALPVTSNVSPSKEEVQMALSVMGFAETEGMSMEDMIAVAQAGFPEDSSGYTVPKDYCPHVAEFVGHRTKEKMDLGACCNVCAHTNENWTCLKCAEVFCGRFVNTHMVDHYHATGHAVTLSHSDLSIWCYECDSYLNNYTIREVNDVYRQAHIMKHGKDLPSSM